jgi:hypothetical protein
MVALVFEAPAGVVADTFSRRWSLVVSHVLMGTAMVATGLVTGFGPLGLSVVAGFRERRFVPAPARRWSVPRRQRAGGGKRDRVLRDR